MLNRCYFSGNDAFYDGVIFATQSNTSIDQCKFSNNQGTARSRLIFIVGGEASLSWTNFTHNYEVFLVVFGFTSIKDCMFENNRVPESTNSIGLVTVDYGAILLADRSTVVITRCFYLANEATASYRWNNSARQSSDEY